MLTFSCVDDRSKLKLYDEGAGLSLDKTITILSMKEASSRELQESKTATIERVGLRAPGKTAPQYAQRSETKSQRRQPPDRCGYCGRDHPRGKINCPAANVRCDKCTKVGHFAAVCRSKPNTRVSQVVDAHEGEVLEHNQTFVGRVLAVPQTDNTLPDQDKNVDITSSENQVSEAEALMPEISTDYIRDPGWHVKLRVEKRELTWCINTGAQVSVMPETLAVRQKADRRRGYTTRNCWTNNHEPTARGSMHRRMCLRSERCNKTACRDPSYPQARVNTRNPQYLQCQGFLLQRQPAK
ncbi:predicted protein [Nematostella vectensis]|uniref:Uncharacterized protein n=1 Tax=Nematostella vectensis TaxID=45351 RepID=A7RWI9_NEMVE|nr:predicted protein [Nematostella vectensis]|eukprot:XP_001636238.1 predicted protein [Nematostella vectensis]